MAPQHFAIPLRLGTDGSYATIEQDTIDEVAQCVSVLVSVVEGFRPEVPGFGVPEMVFSSNPGIQAALIQAQIKRWEPRAASLVTLTPEKVDQLVSNLRINVGLANVNQ